MSAARTFPMVTVLVALTTAAVLLVLPTYSNGDTLVEVNGGGVLVVLLAPAAIALLGVLVPRTGVLTAIACLFGVATMLAMLTVGIFFVPTLAASFVAVATANRR